MVSELREIAQTKDGMTAEEIIEGVIYSIAEGTGSALTLEEAHVIRASLRTHAPTETVEQERAIRHEDGHPHESHRWVSGGEYGGSPPWVCGDCGVDIEDDEALDPCKTAEPGEDDVPLWIRRALSLVERALESEDGMRSVMKQTGGNAPELVQGILDEIARLRRSAPREVVGYVVDHVSEGGRVKHIGRFKVIPEFAKRDPSRYRVHPVGPPIGDEEGRA